MSPVGAILLLASAAVGVRHPHPIPLRHQLSLQPFQETYEPGQLLRVMIPIHTLAGAEECELLLRAKGLRVEVVRLTPSRVATQRILAFEVPQLPGLTAHLELRAGIGGREWVAATSPPFFIAFTHQRALPELVFDRGEWWLRREENLDGPRVELIPSPPTWDFFSYQLKAILPPPPQTQLAEVPTRGKGPPCSHSLLANAKPSPRAWRPTVNFPLRE